MLTTTESAMDRAIRAVAKARTFLPQWQGLARAISRNPRLMVRLSTNASFTDGKTIHIKVPPALGDLKDHDTDLCGLRDDVTDVMLCEACDTLDVAQTSIFHEIGHDVAGSFEKLTPAEVENMMIDAIFTVYGGAAEGTRGAKLMDRFKRYINDPLKRDVESAIEVAAFISPFLPTVFNGVEDVWVNAWMMAERPGLIPMFRASFWKVFEHGIPTLDGGTQMWSDRPLNAQATIGLFCKGSNLDYSRWLDPKVVADLDDPEIDEIIELLPTAFGARDRFVIAVYAYEALRRKGYFVDADDPEDDEPHPGESDSGEADGKKSDPKDADPNEGDDSDDGDDEPAGSESTGREVDEEEGDTPDDSDGPESDFHDEGGESDDSDASDEADADDPGEDAGITSDDPEGDDDGSDSGPSAPSDEGEAGGEGDDVTDPGGDDSSSPEGEPGSSEPTEDMGSPEDVERSVEHFGGHVKETDSPTDHSDDEDDADDEATEGAIDRVIEQGEHFDKPSDRITGLRVVGADEGSGSFARGVDRGLNDPADFEVPLGVTAEALVKMRIFLADNRAGRKEQNLSRGTRINAKALARKLPSGDTSFFTKRAFPALKDYFVVIGVDVSGSTSSRSSDGRVTIQVMKQAVYAQAELLAKLGIRFAIYAHSGSLGVVIFEVKKPTDLWDARTKQALFNLGPYAANLDGHTLEFYRKVAERDHAKERIILYYTDGAMPCENYTEELEVLTENIRICHERDLTLMAVGVGNDDPKDYGLPTVRLDSIEDVPAVVKFLGDRLAAK